jgi:shikimate 5-dehydrogenase
MGARVVVLARNRGRAESLAFEAGARAATPEEACREGVDLVVNCTCAGMWPDTGSCAWPDRLPLPAGCRVYDMVYRPVLTELLRRAESQGLEARGGLGMLARQARHSFRFWTGLWPPLGDMASAARLALDEALRGC